jgi:hypothetical protein
MTKRIRINGTKLADIINGTELRDKIKGRAGNDIIYGNGGNDKIKGGAGDDWIMGGAGSDDIDGGKGIDIAVYQGTYQEYVFSFSHSGNLKGTVSDSILERDGTDTLKNVEFIQFSNAIYDVENDILYTLGHPPVLTNPVADVAFLEDHAVDFTIPAGTFTDADNDPLTYTATLADGSALPAWLTFNAATRAFSGTPPQDFNGALTIRVTASDASASAFGDPHRR